MNMAHQFELGSGYACKARWLGIAWRRLEHGCYCNDQRSKQGVGGLSRSPYLIRSFVLTETGLTGILDRSLCFSSTVFQQQQQGNANLDESKGFC
jgi:hypothetical protein